MPKKILVCADSTCDLSPELIERYGIIIMHLHVRLGDDERLDGLDVTPDDLYDYYKKTGKLPATSAGTPTDYHDFFEKYSSPDTELIHFHISSDMSATYNNSLLASQDFDNVYVVDSRNLSAGIGHLVIEAAEMVRAGELCAADIAQRCRALTSHINVSFILDNLEFLWKGGRCSGVAVLGANMLRLKPCIEVKDGILGVGKKYRGKHEAVLREYVKDKLNRDDLVLDRIFVTHSGMEKPEVINDIVKLVKECAPFKEVFVTKAGCSISTHCGPNTLGILFITK